MPTQPQVTLIQSSPTFDALDEYITHQMMQQEMLNAAQTAQVQINDLPTTGWVTLTESAISKKYSKKEVVDPTTNGDKQLQDLYSYKLLTIRKQDSIQYERHNKIIGNPYKFATYNGLIGIEIEVENICNPLGQLEAYWASKADGSLRNNGTELVSVPLQIKQVQLALEHAWNVLYKNNNPDFSNRTSIHIHLNCRDLTQNQLYTLCLLYAVFEKHFYAYAGTRRLNSIFCVPWFRTNICKSLKSVIYRFTPEWHKYTGLNLLPLVDNNDQRGFGTIEFRQLYGTKDLTSIYKWIDQILCLRKAALTMKLDEVEHHIREMNTTSSYMDLYYRIFGEHCILQNKSDFEECISNLKREIFDNEYSKTFKKSDNSDYWQTCRKLGLRG